MKWIRITLVAALLFQAGYTPCFGDESVILKGSEITPDKLIPGEFVEVVYHTLDSRKETAKGYLKSADAHALTLARGRWKETIPYARVLAIRLPGSPLSTGSWVRISTSQQYIGRLISRDAENLVMRSEHGQLLSFPYTSNMRLEVSRGRKTNITKGALWGFCGGLIMGLLCAPAIKDLDPYVREKPKDTGQIIFLFAGGGLVIGGAVGRKVRSEKWQEIPLEQLRLSQHVNGITLCKEFTF